MLTAELQKELHRRFADFLDMQDGSDPEEVASHSLSAGNTRLAAERYCDATLRASKVGDSESVLRCSNRSLALSSDERDRYSLHMARAEAHHFLGDYGAQGRELDQAMELATSDLERARVLSQRIGGLWYDGKREEAEQASVRAVDMAERAGYSDLLARTLARAATVFAIAGKNDLADESLDRAEQACADATKQARALVLSARGTIAAKRGLLAHSLQVQTLHLLEEVGDVRRAANTATNLADTLNFVGEYEEAERALQSAAEKCRRVRLGGGELNALINRSYALTMLGRTDEALTVLDEAHTLAERFGHERPLCRIRLGRIRARFAAGEPELAAEARTEAELQQSRMPMDEAAVAATVAAQISQHEGSVEDALRWSSEAMRIRDSLGGLELDEGLLFHIHAACLEVAGRKDEAAAVRKKGQDRLSAVASKIEDPKWQQLFLEAVPGNRELMRPRRAKQGNDA
jgi:tetratricopeptide (TPR) repeat protein